MWTALRGLVAGRSALRDVANSAFGKSVSSFFSHPASFTADYVLTTIDALYDAAKASFSKNPYSVTAGVVAGLIVWAVVAVTAPAWGRPGRRGRG